MSNVYIRACVMKQGKMKVRNHTMLNHYKEHIPFEFIRISKLGFSEHITALRVPYPEWIT